MFILPVVLHQDTLPTSYQGLVNPHESLGPTAVNANIPHLSFIPSGSVTWSADKGHLYINSVKASLEFVSLTTQGTTTTIATTATTTAQYSPNPCNNRIFCSMFLYFPIQFCSGCRPFLFLIQSSVSLDYPTKYLINDFVLIVT